MKATKIFCLTLLAIQLLLICFANRTLYLSSFDASYWKDKYDHSQWKLPLSVRTLGDDGLYLYEGYRLIHGGDPTTFNAEMPPLGKYLIGTSILLFGNGYVFGLIISTLSIVACFWLFITITGDTTLSLVGITLLAVDPLITQQFTLTMLDSLQLLFFVLFLGSITNYMHVKTERKQYFFAIMSGVSIGFFAATKFPVLAPPFAGIAILSMWKTQKKIFPIGLFIISAIGAYLIPYIPYFFMHHSILDWLSVQKWIIAFYLKSGLAPTIGSVFTTLLFGKNQNLFTHVYEPVSEWSFAWPCIAVATCFGFIYKNIRLWPTRLCLGMLILFYAIIPFWTRYLIILLPLLYLGSILILKKISQPVRTLFVLLLIGVNMFTSLHILFPSSQTTINQFLTDWRHGAFQDMYEATSQKTQQTMSRSTFYLTGKTYFYDAQIEDVEFSAKMPSWNIVKTSEQIPVRITYKTRNLGMLNTTILLPMVKEKGLWKVAWSWDLLFPKLHPTYTLKTTVEAAERGSLFTKNSQLLAGDIPSVMVWLLPDQITTTTEEMVFAAIEQAFSKNIKSVHIQERFVRFSDLHQPIPIGVIMHPIDQKTEKALALYPAIMTTPAFGRTTQSIEEYDIGDIKNVLYGECCSFFYTTNSYDGVSGLEKQYNETLKGYNGGTLMMTDKNNKAVLTLIDRKKQDGVDVKLEK